MKKRILAIGLMLCMIAWAVFYPLEASAVQTMEEKTTANGLKYQVIDDAVKITGYIGSITNLHIPSTIDEMSVTSIGQSAFANCIKFENVVIPNGVTSIGKSAFEGCKNLYSITVPDSVTSIGEGAFKGCKKLREFTIPDGVTYIGKETFYNCNELKSIVIPSGVTSINESTFMNCVNLREITIPDSVTSIGDDAFNNCVMLNIVIIPDKVTSIGVGAFKGCSNLKEIMVPDSVTSIGEGAFSMCTVLNDVYIPNGVTSIGKETFYYCKGLTRINIPDSVTSIGESAFRECNNLADISISNNVTSIKDDTFCGCRKVSVIWIPESVTSIADSAFRDCISLTNIEVEENNATYASEVGILYNKNKTQLIRCPEGTSFIDEIPDSVTSIRERAFSYCQNLTDITIPASITSIGEEAFFSCQNLTNVTISDGVTSIGEGAFTWCINLNEVTIPDSVTSIGNYAFDECNDELTLIVNEGSYGEEYAASTGATMTVIPCKHENEKIVTDKEVPATCTTEGKTAGSHCSVCNAVITEQETVPAKGHTIVTDKEVPATCTTEGKTAGSHCSLCNAVITKQETVPAFSHNYETTITKATTYMDGSIIKKCTVCDKVDSAAVIAYPNTIGLSKTVYTYNGKVKRPFVTVMDSNNKILKEGIDYTISGGEGRNVGKYAVTVTFKANYSGMVEKTFIIQPKSTVVSKLSARKKGFTVKWKKQTKKTTGYQIQYSTKKKFTGKTTKTKLIKKNKKTSKSITKLKAGKKYYVRVRTYKKVKVKGKNTNIYSSWSKVKRVKTKK